MKTTHLSGLELKFPYRPESWRARKELYRVQLLLDSCGFNELHKTFMLIASNSVANIPTSAANEAVFRIHPYASSEYSCLVMRMTGIGRSNLLIVPNNEIPMVDRKINEALESGAGAIEIQSQTLLLTEECVRTAYSHCAQTVWPADLVEFFWTDIEPDVPEQPA